MTKHTLTSPWREVERKMVAPFRSDHWESGVQVFLESADIRTRDGFEHTDGTYRVRSVKVLDGRSARRSRRFNGEMAWANGQREFTDAVNAVYHDDS